MKVLNQVPLFVGSLMTGGLGKFFPILKNSGLFEEQVKSGMSVSHMFVVSIK